MMAGRAERFAAFTDLELVILRKALMDCYYPDTDADFKKELDDELRVRAKEAMAR